MINWLVIPIFVDSQNLANHLAKKLLVSLISAYQKYLSPYKGFSCAHRILYKGESCSNYMKRNLLEQDLITAIKISNQRFDECAQAHDTLVAQSQKTPEGKETKRRKFLQLLFLGFLTPFLLGARGSSLGKCCAKSGKNSDDFASLCKLFRCWRCSNNNNNDDDNK